MLAKLQDLKKKMDDIKNRLDNITVEGSAGNDAVKIELTANRAVKSISISDSLLQPEKKEELIDYLEMALGDVLEKTENISQAEMQAAGQGILPGMSGP